MYTDKDLESLHNNPVKYCEAYRRQYGEALNKNKQNRHVYGHKSLKENASYFKNDLETLQKIVDEKAGVFYNYLRRLTYPIKNFGRSSKLLPISELDFNKNFVDNILRRGI